MSAHGGDEKRRAAVRGTRIEVVARADQRAAHLDAAFARREHQWCETGGRSSMNVRLRFQERLGNLDVLTGGGPYQCGLSLRGLRGIWICTSGQQPFDGGKTS